jgi:hypothetical protein
MIYPVHEINLRQPYQLPVLGYKDILTKIVEDAGYTWDNQLDTVDANYLDRLAITFSKRSIRYSQRFREQYEFSASPDGTQVINADSTHKQVLFPVTNKSGAAGWWNSGASTFETEALPHNLGLRLFVNIVVEVSGYTSGNILFTLHDGSFPYFYPDTTVIIGTTINANGVHTVAFRMDTRVIGDNAEDFMVTVVAPNGATVEVLSGSFYAEIEEKPVGVWQMSNIVLPDMPQKDFFVDFLRRFGMLFYQNGTTIVTRPLKRLINDREDAPDWTAKRDASFEDEISFVHGQYAQSNIFSDSGADELEKGRLIVDGDQLEAEREIYTSRFVTPDYIIVDGVRIVRVPVFGFDSDDRLTVSEDFQEGVRLVYLRDAMDGDPAVEYEGTPTNDHFVAVYDDPRSEKRADWQFFLDNYYEEFRRCLNEAKVVRRRYFLDVLDVQGLDLTKPVYDSGAYYMVEKVENYVPGQSTKVTLFKVS